jgi:RHS repeat-associated protein
MQDEITWDRVGNKTSEEMTTPGLRPLGHRYEYDSVGRMVHSQRSRSSGPPALGGRRGKRAGQNRSYHLDGVGNRTQVSSSPAGALPGDGKYVTDSVNAYIKTPFDTRVHDANGNLTAIDPGTPTRRLITYDVRDRMVGYLVVATGELTRYAYDALGRRTIKVRDVTGNPKATSYLYDGWRVIEERDDADQVQATYAYGNDIDERLSMERGGSEYWYHPDDLHSVRALSDSGGVVVERYEYDDFGQVTVRDGSGKRITGSALANPYLFTGRRLDLETGWYEYRTRYMDPLVGKFTTRDTIGIWGDEFNLGSGLAYVGANPVSRRDPMGRDVFVKNFGGLHSEIVVPVHDGYGGISGYEKYSFRAKDYSTLSGGAGALLGTHDSDLTKLKHYFDGSPGSDGWKRVLATREQDQKIRARLECEYQKHKKSPLFYSVTFFNCNTFVKQALAAGGGLLNDYFHYNPKAGPSPWPANYLWGIDRYNSAARKSVEEAFFRDGQQNLPHPRNLGTPDSPLPD